MKGIVINLLVFSTMFVGISCWNLENDNFTYEMETYATYVTERKFVFPVPQEKLLGSTFKISIPDRKGINSVVFNGVLNLDVFEECERVLASHFYIQLKERNFAGEWAYESNFEVKFGDHVYYSVDIMHWGIEYKMENFFFGIALYEGNLVLI